MNEGKILLGVLAGVAAGATLGILFAPDSGVNTRRKIIKKGEDYAGNLRSQYHQMTESLNEEVDGFKDEINRMVSDGKAKMHDEKAIANTIKNELGKAVS